MPTYQHMFAKSKEHNTCVPVHRAGYAPVARDEITEYHTQAFSHTVVSFVSPRDGPTI